MEKISAKMHKAYREHVMIAFMYRRCSMGPVELRNLTLTRNWRVF
jgi:hypothetical protein